MALSKHLCRKAKNFIERTGAKATPGSGDQTPVIELQDVGYSYGGGDLLSGMTLSLLPGSFHFLTGPSGSGKTTFRKLCYGELKATSPRSYSAW